VYSFRESKLQITFSATLYHTFASRESKVTNKSPDLTLSHIFDFKKVIFQFDFVDKDTSVTHLAYQIYHSSLSIVQV
jgi:hypothetical protein